MSGFHNKFVIILFASVFAITGCNQAPSDKLEPVFSQKDIDLHCKMIDIYLEPYVHPDADYIYTEDNAKFISKLFIDFKLFPVSGVQKNLLDEVIKFAESNPISISDDYKQSALIFLKSFCANTKMSSLL
jgi:hypothetical protein